MIIPHLLFDNLAEDCEFHAALVTTTRTRSAQAYRHTHDFHEMLYITEGQGEHWINGNLQQIKAGHILFIDPEDCHDFTVRPGQKLHFINIAFRAEAWRDFREFSRLEAGPGKNTIIKATPVQVPDDVRAECAAAFNRCLHSYHERPTRMELCRFWFNTAGFLGARQTQLISISGPDWFVRACQAMTDPQNLNEGFPKFLELSGVTSSHLCRSCKTALGQSPTEFINCLRLQRAAMLLSTTTQDILTISLECGFENLPYFYRLFQKKYDTTPRTYRLSAGQAVLV